jgi:hypothetical protein
MDSGRARTAHALQHFTATTHDKASLSERFQLLAILRRCGDAE